MPNCVKILTFGKRSLVDSRPTFGHVHNFIYYFAWNNGILFLSTKKKKKGMLFIFRFVRQPVLQ